MKKQIRIIRNDKSTVAQISIDGGDWAPMFRWNDKNVSLTFDICPGWVDCKHRASTNKRLPSIDSDPNRPLHIQQDKFRPNAIKESSKPPSSSATNPMYRTLLEETMTLDL